MAFISDFVETWKNMAARTKAAKAGYAAGLQPQELLAQVGEATILYDESHVSLPGQLLFILTNYRGYITASKALAQAEGQWPAIEASSKERSIAVHALQGKYVAELEELAMAAGYGTPHDLKATVQDWHINGGFLRTKEGFTGETFYVACATGQADCIALVRGTASGDQLSRSLVWNGLLWAVGGVLRPLDPVALLARNQPRLTPYHLPWYGKEAARLLADEAASSRMMVQAVTT